MEGGTSSPTLEDAADVTAAMLVHAQLLCWLCCRALMCARSEYFAAMLCGAFAEGQQVQQGEVTLDDVEAVPMATALTWVYSDIVDADASAHLLLQVGASRSL